MTTSDFTGRLALVNFRKIQIKLDKVARTSYIYSGKNWEKLSAG